MSRQSETALSIDHLSVVFGGLKAVDDVTLDIQKGAFVGIVGPNGAGKSTLVQTISGFVRPSSGAVSLFGNDITTARPHKRVALGLGRTFQTSRVFPAMTVEESILVGEQRRLIGAANGVPAIGPLVEPALALLGTSGYRRRQDEMRARAEMVMALFGERLIGRRGDPAHSLSYANRRRLDIARALVAEPRVLLLDEPTAGMNPTETAELAGVLEEVAARFRDMTIVMIEHKLDLIRRLTERTIVISQGAVIVDAPPQEALSHPDVAEAYLGHHSAGKPDASVAGGGLSLDFGGGDGETSPPATLDEVSVFYGPVQALFEVSITVGRGEVVAVLGGNASGKSTVIKTVLGLTDVRSGDVTIFGTPVQRGDTPERIAQGIASIPEGRRMFAEMTVEDNLLLGAYPRRREKGFDDKAALATVYEEFHWLADRRTQLAGTLSGGEQQMVAMARAYLRRPRLLCIDEPSMGLSPAMVDRVYEILTRWKAAGMTILMVEQSANRALELADRAYVLQNGRIVTAGDTATLRNDPAVKAAYLGISAEEADPDHITLEVEGGRP
ncbi:MAG: ATP-binding cassette domain-containing protein [Devosia sp.]